MKKCEELKEETNEADKEKDFERINSLSMLIKGLIDTKNYVLDEREGATELKRLLRDPGVNPCRNLTQVLTTEMQQTVADTEL